MFLTLTLVLVTLGLLYLFLIWNFNYWTKRGIVSPKPLPYFGNFPKAYKGKRHLVYDVDDIYQKYKDTEDFVGIFNIRTPQLLILNPELCRRILIDDFKHFHDNEFSTFTDKRCDFIVGNNPYALTGDDWQDVRSLLKNGIETETSKAAFYAIQDNCKKMRLKISDQLKQLPLEGIKLKDLCLHFTAQTVTQCAFGFNFCGQPSTTFVFDEIFSIFYAKMNMQILYLLIYLVPAFKKFYKVRMLPQRVQILFERLMQTAIELRKSQIDYKSRHDFLNYLLYMQKQKEMSTLEMTTYSMNFIMHGFLGIYTILAHCLLLLAKHPKVQQSLRYEIQQQIKKTGCIDLDKLAQLPFLEACIYETIRILPPGFYHSKVCTEPIVLSNKSGRSISLKKGEVVILPSYSFMHDESFYPNANEFRPERFIDENGAFRNDIYKSGLYYGFGAGPRECVGKHFSLMQIKAALIEIFSHFKICINEKTTECIEIDPKYYSIRLDSEIWLDFEAINGLDFR